MLNDGHSIVRDFPQKLIKDGRQALSFTVSLPSKYQPIHTSLETVDLLG